jgi:hypothetical protein
MNDKHIDVTLKWLAGEMSNTEAAKALRVKSSRNIYSTMGVNMRELYRLGLIKRVKRVRVGTLPGV